MKALVLSSGGVDSTTCLGMAVDKYGADQVLALSVYYGQKHDKELEAAKKVAVYYGVAWKELDLAVLFADSDCSLLAGSDAEIPKESFPTQQESRFPPMCPSGTVCFWRQPQALPSPTDARSFTTAHTAMMPQAMPIQIAAVLFTKP